MNIDQLLEQIQTNYDEFTAFHKHHSLEVELDLDVLPTSLEELGVTLEELTIAQEELIQQNQELEASRHQVERERQRYRQLFEMAPEAYVVTDTAGIIKECNRAACQLFGVAPLHSMGKALISFVPLEDRFNFRYKINQLPETLSINAWEMKLLLRTGEPVQVSVNACYQSGEYGDEPSLLWLIRNISDRYRAQAATKRAIAAETGKATLQRDIEARRCLEKALRESEARYRYIFESLGVAIWEKDFSGVKQDIERLKATGVEDFSGYLRDNPSFIEKALPKVVVLNVNDTAKRLCRAREKIELLGSLTTAVTPGTMNCFRQILLAMASGETYISGETVLQTLDGNLINVLFTSYLPAIGQPGDRVLMTAIDISERQRAEEKLQEQAEKLERLNNSLLETTTLLAKSNQDLSSFVHRVSHALKAPLRGIANLAIWLEQDLDQYLDGEMRYNMNLLTHRVERLEEMIESLLNYSRVGRSVEEAVKINLRELIESTIEYVSSSHSFHIENLLEGNETLIGKRSLLFLVFQQLLDNAIRHHRNREGLISFACKKRETCYEFSVQDDGPGIPPEYHEKIFDILQVVPPSKPMDNIGIGLAMVKKIVENEGGRIWLESDPGKGSTFYFTWPE
ncbi:MAG: Adaptive-response sensory-kinase SasA [Chroococcopsis gigantea SAG 12.99]|jgi:PAS domain S-box-containing protein|nr:Adaptive-response sensory-kinase SasA [Chroococcopsis gigantea SAG 12.99]